uniref:Uncharacterized protein MANES_01G261800 n=1 Tax=Rhizophora mucronata TaxID=61149 RepID=A0A2P2KVI2_RHIMU
MFFKCCTVIENGLSKQMCLRMFKYLNGVVSVIEPSCGGDTSLKVGCSKFMEWENLEREHRVYSFLAHGCTSFTLQECVLDAISASSTDNSPLESIHNTLVPTDRIGRRASYWSSKGQSNPMVPEMLIYKLVADVCVITEISIRPFQAYFQLGMPIYSAKSVCFRMGHPKFPMDEAMGEPSDNCADNNFVWTYISPEFPMVQENCLQKFELPEPVICIGGILMVELLGRVQRQEIDNLFYICVSHVQVMGRPLSPAFGVEILEPSGKFLLKAQSYNQRNIPEHDIRPFPGADMLYGVRDLERIVNMLRGPEIVIAGYDWNAENDESDEEIDAAFAD